MLIIFFTLAKHVALPWWQFTCNGPVCLMSHGESSCTEFKRIFTVHIYLVPVRTCVCLLCVCAGVREHGTRCGAHRDGTRRFVHAPQALCDCHLRATEGTPRCIHTARLPTAVPAALPSDPAWHAHFRTHSTHGAFDKLRLPSLP